MLHLRLIFAAESAHCTFWSKRGLYPAVDLSRLMMATILINYTALQRIHDYRTLKNQVCCSVICLAIITLDMNAVQCKSRTYDIHSTWDLKNYFMKEKSNAARCTVIDY